MRGKWDAAWKPSKFDEHLALAELHPSSAAPHRLTIAETQSSGQPAPTYAAVREIVLTVDPVLVILP